MKTVGDIRKAIANLPDDMPLYGYNGSDGQVPISMYINDPATDEPEVFAEWDEATKAQYPSLTISVTY
jgi:hypothetical protein